MNLPKIKATASELEAELRRLAVAIKVSPALRTIDEQSDKLSELADVAGLIADSIDGQLVTARLDGFDAVRDALDSEVTN